MPLKVNRKKPKRQVDVGVEKSADCARILRFRKNRAADRCALSLYLDDGASHCGRTSPLFESVVRKRARPWLTF